MHFTLIKSLPEMNLLADEWNGLLQESASHVPFLRHEYLTGWWQTLGGGEWPQGDLCVCLARHEDGSLAGAAPLFYTQNRDGDPALMFLGCIEISDYLDVVARPDDLPAFWNGLLAFLNGPQLPPWRVLDLWNFLDQSASLPALQAAAQQQGWRYTQELWQHCPHILLPGDWETYLSTQVDKKQRHEIRRKMRRSAEESPAPVRWYIVEQGAHLPSEVDAFLELMAQDIQKRSFLTEAMRRQFHLTAQAAFDAGWLQLAFLEIGGQKAAGYFNFDFLNRIWVYNSGIDFSFRELSPGWVLLGHLLQWANEHKREAFDFMRGDEDYKYRFGGIDRRVARAIVRR